MTVRVWQRLCAFAALGAISAPGSAALAQAKNPFSVGISEGGGSASGWTGWLLAQQGWFEHQLSGSIRLLNAQHGAVWPLVGLSLLYGIFHAAGPGHGKAVLASYMIANERALRRGVTLSLFAALLQGAVAIAIVGVLAVLLRSTAQHMKEVAARTEQLSFGGVACLGVWLVWRKGRLFTALLRSRAPRRLALPDMLYASTPRPALVGGQVSAFLQRGRDPGLDQASRFTCTEVEATHDPTCPHCHAVDPAALAGEAFSLRDAALTVFAAGSRPCSGAILVLVFALAQGMFWAGVLSVLAMSIGVAATTAALASVAVLGKSLAARLARADASRTRLLFGGLELLAACLVLAIGIALLLGSTSLGSA